MIRVFRFYGQIMLLFILIWSALVCYINLGIQLDWTGNSVSLEFSEFKFLDWLKSFLLLGVTAHVINLIYQSYELVKIKNSYAGAFYILLVGLIPGAVELEHNTWIVLALLAGIFFLFRTYRKLESTTMIFNIGLLVGIILWIDLSYWPLILYFFYGVVLINYFKLNEWILYLLAIGLPFFYYYVYLSFDSTYQSFPLVFGEFNYRWDRAFFQDQYPVIAVVTLLSLIYVIRQSEILRNLRMGTRKYYSLIHYLFILGILAYLFIDYPPKFGLKIMAVPLSIMLATRCTTTKSKSFTLVLFYFLILTLILFNLYY